MKTRTCQLWLGAMLLLLSSYASARAQGQISFNNFQQGVIDAPIFDQDGVTRLGGSGFLAQLYVGLKPDSLVPASPPTTFGTGNRAGYVVPVVVTPPGVGVGDIVYVQVRAWDASAGASYEAATAAGARVGESNLIKLVVGGGTTLPSLLAGLGSFGITPYSLRVGSPMDLGGTVSGTITNTSCDSFKVGTKYANTYTAANSGQLVIFVEDTQIDPVVEIYYGFWSSDTLTNRIACADLTAANSFLSISAQSNRLYSVVVGGKLGGKNRGAGTYKLSATVQDARPKLRATLLTPGTLRLEVTGPPGARYAIDSSSTFSFQPPTSLLWQSQGFGQTGFDNQYDDTEVSTNGWKLFRAYWVPLPRP